MDNLNLKFEAERLCRAVDTCEDINALKEKTKELIRTFYLHKEMVLKMGLQK